MGQISIVFLILIAVALLWASFGPNAFDFHRDHRTTNTGTLVLAGIFGICLAVIVGNRNSPFLYFQF
jgi:hypothetical protein